MQFVAPLPFTEAIEKLGSKNVVTSVLKSADWSNVPLALRDRAFFSSTIESGRFLQRAKDFLDDFLASSIDETAGALAAGSRSQFVDEMSELAQRLGLGPLDPEDAGGLRDIRSQTRLSLIFNTLTQQANDFGYWKQGMDADLLDEFPAQRFIRIHDVTAPRVIHQQNEGVVRLKTDLRFWMAMNDPKIGGFGVPWGPWGFNSGMDVDDVDRAESESLGLIKPGEKLKPVDKDFNDHLEASAAGLDARTLNGLQNIFGDQVKIVGDSIAWNRAGEN